MFSCEYSKCFRDSFFIEQLWWLLLNYVLVFKNKFEEKKVKGDIHIQVAMLNVNMTSESETPTPLL